MKLKPWNEILFEDTLLVSSTIVFTTYLCNNHDSELVKRCGEQVHKNKYAALEIFEPHCDLNLSTICLLESYTLFCFRLQFD